MKLIIFIVFSLKHFQGEGEYRKTLDYSKIYSKKSDEAKDFSKKQMKKIQKIFIEMVIINHIKLYKVSNKKIQIIIFYMDLKIINIYISIITSLFIVNIIS